VAYERTCDPTYILISNKNGTSRSYPSNKIKPKYIYIYIINLIYPIIEIFSIQQANRNVVDWVPDITIFYNKKKKILKRKERQSVRRLFNFNFRFFVILIFSGSFLFPLLITVIFVQRTKGCVCEDKYCVCGIDRSFPLHRIFHAKQRRARPRSWARKI